MIWPRTGEPTNGDPIYGRGKKLLSYSKWPYRLWSPSSPTFNVLRPLGLKLPGPENDHLPPSSIARAERDGTRAETRFRLSLKRTSPFKSVGVSVQSTAGSWGVGISLSNAGYTTFGGGVRVLATHSDHQFPLHFPSRASPCATRFRTSSTEVTNETSHTYRPSLSSWRLQDQRCIFTACFWINWIVSMGTWFIRYISSVILQMVNVEN